MKERIRLLAEQAGIVFWEISGDVDWRQANRENLEKFAELIIIECASIVYQTCRDGDAGAQAILYEFDIDHARSQK